MTSTGNHRAWTAWIRRYLDSPQVLCRVLGPVLVAGLIAVLPSRAAAQDVLSFDETRAYPVAANAKGFSAGDCDNDGFMDIIAAGQHADAVTVLINDETGVFNYGETVPVGSQPSGAACGDFNADGLIDVAALSRDLGTVSIYHRQESGGFSLAGSRPAGFLPTALTPGHLNSDGFIDLVAVGSKSNDITFLLGTGTDLLPPSASIRAPMDSPHAAAIADFNLDGKPDIAVAGAADPFVAILFGDGVSFVPQPDSVPSPFQDTRRPNHSKGIAAGDLNNDGSPDLAVLTANSAIILYLGDGTGKFTAVDNVTGPDGAEALVLDDFDLDGSQDIGVLYSSTNSVQILFADGPGVFPVLTSTPRAQDAVNGFGPIDARTVLVDPLDPESTQLQLLAVDNSKPSSLAVVEQENLSRLSVSSLQAIDAGPLGLRLGDINGDEIPDALVNRKSRSKVFPLEVMIGTETGGFLPLTAIDEGECGNGVIEGQELCDDGNTKSRDGCSKSCLPEVKGPVASVEIAHVDDDEHTDLIVVDKSGRLTVLIGNGAGRFLDVRPITKVKRKTPAIVMDFTADGFPDIVIVPKSSRAGTLQLLVNDGLGEFIPVAIRANVKLKGPVLGGDIDGNGAPDIVAGSRKGWTIFFNDGLGPVRNSGELVGPKKPLGFAAADFDEDGFVDVLGSYKPSRRSPAAVLFRGGPGGVFGAGIELDLPGAAGRSYVADLDQDLHQDIVTCEDGARPLCTAFYGNGKAEFGAAAVGDGTFIGRDVRGAGVADFDGDGTVDLVGVSRRDNRGKIMFRHADRALREQTALDTGQKPAALAVADLDSNGLPDIIVANEGSSDLSIFMSQGSRTYPAPAPVRLPVGGLGAPALAVGDINGDTRPDIAVTQAGSDTVTPFLNLGGIPVALGPQATGDEPRGVALGNLNGDNTLDIATANRGDNTFSVLLSQPDGSYARTDYPSAGQRPSAVAIADLDDDGSPDVIVTNEKIQDEFKTGNIAVFLNTAGDGTFGAPASTHVRGRATPRAICVGDFDDDDTPDIAVASIDSNDVMVLHGDGTGGWRADERAFPVGQQAVSVWCLDADGDGRTDISYGRRNAGDVGAILTGQQ